ncbi:MAG: addiction module toxin, HicA family [Elusimicrobia bacterium CG_4_10_14_3_um_filter_49_12_50_7]|nr:MAG: addiction module toxin, HicA family [Elusimicrobia bacterium CG_4_10_14_3_um_filter_49_12_50_7]
MSRFPSFTPNEVIRKLRKAGFVFDRHAKGSHEIWYNPATHRRTVVPNHPGKDIPKKTLMSVIKQSGLSAGEFAGL